MLQLLALAALGLLVIVAAHLFEPYDWSRNAKNFIKTFHSLGFAVVAFVLVGVFRQRGHRPRSYFYAAVAAMFAGVVSEVAQLSVGRDADVGDLLRNAIGIVAGLGLATIFDPVLRHRKDRVWLALVSMATVAALVASFWHPVTSAHALWARNAALPKLATFGEGWESHLYEEANGPTARRIVRPPDWPVTTDDIVLWTESTGRWNTFLHLRPYPDWRGYGAFSFVAAAADKQEYELQLEIWDTPPGPDDSRNRFSRNFSVTPTPERFTIRFDEIADSAAERAFDFEHVDLIIVSRRGDGGRGTVLLDDFQLER